MAERKKNDDVLRAIDTFSLSLLCKLNAANIQLLLSSSCVPVCVLVDNFEAYMKRINIWRNI